MLDQGLGNGHHHPHHHHRSSTRDPTTCSPTQETLRNVPAIMGASRRGRCNCISYLPVPGLKSGRCSKRKRSVKKKIEAQCESTIKRFLELITPFLGPSRLFSSFFTIGYLKLSLHFFSPPFLNILLN